MKRKHNDIFKFSTIFILLILIIVIIHLTLAYILPWVYSLKNPELKKHFEDYILNLGYKGIIIMLLVQVLQIVSMIIPAEPIQVSFGVLYGTFWGSLLSFIGIFIGSFIVCYGLKFIGGNFIKKFMNSPKMKKFSFLHNVSRLKSILIILFLVPGIPKGVLLYASCFTKVKTLDLLLIATFCRIPSIIIAALAGSSLNNGNLRQTFLILIITAILAGIGILVNYKLSKKRSEKK